MLGCANRWGRVSGRRHVLQRWVYKRRREQLRCVRRRVLARKRLLLRRMQEHVVRPKQLWVMRNHLPARSRQQLSDLHLVRIAGLAATLRTRRVARAASTRARTSTTAGHAEPCVPPARPTAIRPARRRYAGSPATPRTPNAGRSASTRVRTAIIVEAAGSCAPVARPARTVCALHLTPRRIRAGACGTAVETVQSAGRPVRA